MWTAPKTKNITSLFNITLNKRIGKNLKSKGSGEFPGI